MGCFQLGNVSNPLMAIKAACSLTFASLMSLFYHQPGMKCLGAPPELPIPNMEPTGRSSPPYMGCSFPQLCRLWSILSEVGLVYYSDGQSPWGSRGSLPFAEYKYRELLAWSNSLPSQLIQDNRNPHHVQILQ